MKHSTALILLPAFVLIVPSWLKLMCSVLDALTYKPTPFYMLIYVSHMIFTIIFTTFGQFKLNLAIYSDFIF